VPARPGSQRRLSRLGIQGGRPHAAVRSIQYPEAAQYFGDLDPERRGVEPGFAELWDRPAKSIGWTAPSTMSSHVNLCEGVNVTRRVAELAALSGSNISG
jgi:hypothetical protein